MAIYAGVRWVGRVNTNSNQSNATDGAASSPDIVAATKHHCSLLPRMTRFFFLEKVVRSQSLTHFKDHLFFLFDDVVA